MTLVIAIAFRAAVLIVGQFVFGDAFVFAEISRWRVA